MMQKAQRLMIGSLSAVGLLGLSLRSLSDAPASSEQSPVFEAEAVTQASGETQGLILGGFPDEEGKLQNPIVIFKALTGISGMTAAQRVEKIAERLTKMTASDPRWFDGLTIGQMNGEWVLKAPASPDGYLLTCDKKMARRFGMQPRELAGAILANIKRVLGLKKTSHRPTPKFRAEAVTQASGATKGLVLAGFPDPNGDLSAPGAIIDVRSATPDMTPAQRAQIIVNRIQQAAAANPRWFDGNISIGRVNGDWVVKAPDSPSGYIVTCDKATAAKIGMQPHQFAEAVISNIQRIAGLKKTHHKWLLKDLLTENRASSYSNILLGDHYYQNGKAPYAAALSDYAIAFEQAPDSVEALEQLIAVNEKIGQKEQKEQAAELRRKLPALRSAAELREQADLACDAAVVARDENKDSAEAVTQWKRAIAGYEKARDAAPDCLSFHLLIADTCKELADTYAIAPPNESQSDRAKREASQADAEARMRDALIQCKNRLYPSDRSHIAPQWGLRIIDETLSRGLPE